MDRAARCHHDHTSSVANGRYGANSRSSTDERACAARCCAEAGRFAAPMVAVAARLDQLDVVVAEVPEERLGALQRLGVLVALERRGRVGDERGQVREHAAIERACGDRRRRAGCAGQDELRGVEQLDRQPAADLHLAGSNAVSTPGPPRAAQ